MLNKIGLYLTRTLTVKVLINIQDRKYTYLGTVLIHFTEKINKKV